MKRVPLRGVYVVVVLFSVLSLDQAWCAKPPELSEREQTAQRLVRSALESEVAGDAQRRSDLLKRALDNAPSYPPANWHLGRVQVEDRWVALDEAVRLSAEDEQRAQYRRLREDAAEDPERELALARWCARAGMKEEAELHHSRLLNRNGVDPKTTAEAMKALGLKNVGGRLVSEQETKRQQEVAMEIQRAMKRWLPQLQRWRSVIEGANEKRRDYAIEQMHKTDEPGIIPVLDTILFDCGPQFGVEVVKLLAKFPEYEATQTLTRYATLSRLPMVREEAIRELKQRPLHEFVPLLLSGLVSPIRSSWAVSEDLFGRYRLRHALYREGSTQNVAMVNDHIVAPLMAIEHHQVAPTVSRVQDGQQKFDWPFWVRKKTVHGYDNFDDSEREAAAVAVWLEAQRREQLLAASNATTNVKNLPVFVALEETTGQFHKRELTTWCDWWRDYNELHDAGSSGRPTRYLYQLTQTSYDIYIREHYHYEDTYVKGISCFLAGTTIWTEQGRVPIEQIKIGDRVLSQNPDTGELSFELVLNTTLRPHSPMIKVTVDGEDIFTTLGHPMWVSKKRWRMAKLLELGDQLHGVSGILTVDGLDDQVPMDEAHNLVIAGHATYFVGQKGVLVHDNTYRAPTQALVPGLLPGSSNGPGLTAN